MRSHFSAGTTALLNYLSHHPGVAKLNSTASGPIDVATEVHHDNKESHSFSGDRWFNHGIGFYENIIKAQKGTDLRV